MIFAKITIYFCKTCSSWKTRLMSQHFPVAVDCIFTGSSLCLESSRDLWGFGLNWAQNEYSKSEKGYRSHGIDPLQKSCLCKLMSLITDIWDQHISKYQLANLFFYVVVWTFWNKLTLYYKSRSNTVFLFQFITSYINTQKFLTTISI